MDLRMKNVIEQGDATPMGQIWEGVRAKETLEAVIEASGWKQAKPSRYTGRGVAIYERPPGAGKSSATISLDPAGPTMLRVSVANCGQGAYTVLQQIVAEALGVPANEIQVQAADTDSQLFDSGVGGSKTTNSTGNAAASAAKDMVSKLIEGVAAHWGCAPDEVEHRGAAFVGPKEQILTLQEAAERTATNGEPIVCTGLYDPPDERKVTSFCAQVAEVEVDPDTGQVFVRRIVSAHDVGTILHPIGHQGQINGGIIQGMGFGICEETPLADGRITTVNLGDFKLPNINDIPQLDTVLLAETTGPVPYLGKAIGELPNVPTAAAIANAVHDAVGVRIMDLPVTAEKVHAALQKLAIGSK
jgi:CO/xanthine dehydrogenase Mo-binding subunit